FEAEDGIRDWSVTGVQTCALPILPFQRRRPQPLLLPDGEVAVLEVGRGQGGRLVAAEGAVERPQLPGDDPRGPAVGDDVVEGQRSEERRVGKEGRCRGWAEGERER